MPSFIHSFIHSFNLTYIHLYTITDICLRPYIITAFIGPYHLVSLLWSDFRRGATSNYFPATGSEGVGFLILVAFSDHGNDHDDLVVRDFCHSLL